MRAPLPHSIISLWQTDLFVHKPTLLFQTRTWFESLHHNKYEDKSSESPEPADIYIVQSKHACFCTVIAWSGKIIFFIFIIENTPILVSTSQGLPQDPFGGILRGIQSQQGLIGAINNFRQAIVSNPELQKRILRNDLNPCGGEDAPTSCECTDGTLIPFSIEYENNPCPPGAFPDRCFCPNGRFISWHFNSNQC